MSALRINLFVAAVALIGASLPANAATVILVGPTVTYTYNDAQASLALYGTPFLVGDNLIFTPNNFRAEASDGGTDMALATFVVDLQANDGNVLVSTALYEGGDYYVSGGAAGVTGSGRLEAISDDTRGVATSLLDFSDLTTVGTVAEWNAVADIDFMATFGAATGVRLTIINDLAAATGGLGELAWIEKKLGHVGIFADSDPGSGPVVPVPAAMWLFASGLGLLLGMVRRRN